MIKRILKWFGILLLILLVLFGSILAYTSYSQAKYDKTAVPYIQRAVPVLSEWDPVTSRPLFAAVALEDVAQEDFERLIDFLSKLGELLSLDEPKFVQVSSGASVKKGTNTIVTYTIDAKYEYGAAVITLRLLDLDGKFEVYSFNVNSGALLD